MQPLDRFELQDWLQTWTQDYRSRPAPLQAKLQADLLALESILQRLQHPILTVATFGLVSRGKSAVCNALLGEKRLATGATHGITRWPRSLRWLDLTDFAVDLVDTPGLDEVAGAERQAMTEAIVAEADLLLVVVNATLTELELTSIQSLIPQKPLLLVLNKIDQYPSADHPNLFVTLTQQLTTVLAPEALPPLIAVAAEPHPRPVQIEWTEGQVTDSWETPEPFIAPLQEALRHHLQTQAIPAFFQRQQHQAEHHLQTIATKTLAFYQRESDRVQHQFLQGRVLWVALCPWVVGDVLGAFLLDLLFIRNLSKVYGWPITSHGLAPLWQTILQNLTLLAIGEWSSHLFSPTDLSLLGTTGPLTLVGGVVIQGLWAGYGSYRIGKATQDYLAASYGSRSSVPPSELIAD
jgi:GTPase SAR1 family protein